MYVHFCSLCRNKKKKHRIKQKNHQKQSQWNEPWNRKYTKKSTCLPQSQVQRLGRQILEALLFLRERGFPSHGHLHSGNVILQNGVARYVIHDLFLIIFHTCQRHVIIFPMSFMRPKCPLHCTHRKSICDRHVLAIYQLK